MCGCRGGGGGGGRSRGGARLIRKADKDKRRLKKLGKLNVNEGTKKKN